VNPVAQLWIVAGPNGAGKTTCVQNSPFKEMLRGVTFLNPDDVTKQLLIARGFTGFADTPPGVLLECFLTAANQVERQVVEAVERGDAVGVETVLSTDKYRALVERVRRLGGLFTLLYVTVASPDVAVGRVANRVHKGGHDVPTVKVAERFHRSLAHLPWFVANANICLIIDNSSDDPAVPAVIRARGSNGTLTYLDPDSPPPLLAALSALPRG
jgi:predicted ABC-type ATPase